MTDIVVHGRWSKFEDRSGGWRAFEIEVPGKDYPIKGVSTKLPELIDKMMSLRDQDITVWYSEEDSTTENPHRPGTFYKNRRLNRVEAGHVEGAASAVATPSSGKPTSSEFQRELSPEAQERIERHQLRELKAQAWRVTAELFSREGGGGVTLGAENPQQNLRLAFNHFKFFQALVLADIAGDLATQVEAASMEMGTGPDDVPFS